MRHATLVERGANRKPERSAARSLHKPFNAEPTKNAEIRWILRALSAFFAFSAGSALNGLGVKRAHFLAGPAFFGRGSIGSGLDGAISGPA